MSKFRTLLAGTGFALMAAPATGGVGATGCDDLSDIAATPLVDFQSRVEPLFDVCANCHGESGAAGLDLRPGEAYDNLVGVASTTNASRLRVEPSSPATSALFLAVSCDSPGGPGFRMPGTTPQERALIRDWIAQGAPVEPRAATPRPVPWMRVPAAVILILLLGLIAGRWLNRPTGA